MKFDFKDLISAFTKGKTTALIKSDGYYDMEHGGVWVDGKAEEIAIVPSAVVPLSQEEMKNVDGGHFQEINKKLYCYMKLPKGTAITHENFLGDKKTYTIMSGKEYAEFDDGLHIYYLKAEDTL